MDCMFCNIISGKMPSIKIYEDNGFLAILDIRPANKGHILLIPKKHVAFISEMTDKEISEFFVLAKEIAVHAVAKLGAKGFNMVYSAGQQAGQQTPHAFLNIIPRFDRDKVNISWEPLKLTQEDYARLQQELAFQKTIKMNKEPKVMQKKEPEETKFYKQKPKHPGYW